MTIRSIPIVISLFFLLFASNIVAETTHTVTLSQVEQAWLDNHPLIRVGGPKSFPPFQFLGSDGAFQGMASDYIQALAEMFNLKTEITKGLPWPKVLEKIKKKEIDVLSCAAQSLDRDSYLIHTIPHLTFPLIIINRKKSTFISSIEDLNNTKVAVVLKVTTYEWLQQDKVAIIPHFVGSPLEALEAVSLGTADATIQNLATATYLIEKNGLANLQIAAPTVYGNYNLSIAIRKDWPELANIFNKGLEAISQKRHHEIRQKWIAVRYEHGIRSRDVIKWILLVVLVSAILLAAFYFSNRALKKEINDREKAEKLLIESEKRFKALHYASFGGVIIHDKGLILDCNHALSEITGFTNEELIGMDGLKLIAPDWLDLVLRNIKNEYNKSYEVEGVRKDGSVYPLAIRGKNVLYKGREGRVIEFRDISELKQAEEELKSEQVRLRTLFNESPVGIASSRDGITLDANRTYLDMFGYDDISELKGQSIFKKIAPQFRKEFEDRVKKRADGKKIATSYESVGLRKDGSQFPFMVSVNRIVLHEEPITFSFLTDITERKQAEEEREKLQAQLNQAQKMETIGTMAGGLAHDYNNLLGAIMGNIDLAEEDATTDSPQAKALNTAMRAAQRAASLTKKFITFSSGGSPLKTAINPQEFLKDTVNIALSGSNIQCDFSIDQDLGMVEIDQGQMSQAIGNIITNTKEAMPQGGTIHLTAHNMSGEQITHETTLKLQGDFFIKIAVEDQGEGILQKNLDKIFDPYFSSKERGAQKGMGLGLTIANSIIHKHAGHIQVGSEEGKGTTISIYLPVLQQNEALVFQSTDKVVDSPPEAREKKTTKILIMDDEEMISDMVKDLLGRLGYEQVEVAPHGEDVLKMYAQARNHGEPFDLLLLDLTIKGGMGGAETIQRLCEMNPEVRAIVCSGFSDDQIVANYAAYGFIGVLAKPFSREELNNAITQALNKK